jgi:hypothetical protein
MNMNSSTRAQPKPQTRRASGAKSSGKKSPRKSSGRTTLAAANKWMAAAHDTVLKLAERNTTRLTGKPRL